ncbi:unnamed protein product [Brassicogethes aeneus]|uniref:Mitochondrial ribonuclease P catalytic subunit n=1 Tax=Brassicogethes aeneus TaxID=1431903 RepID=A0A9P0FCZ0_BRAAE|nr:unnamed protein product [Brassicogethes aeneus]
MFCRKLLNKNAIKCSAKNQIRKLKKHDYAMPEEKTTAEEILIQVFKTNEVKTQKDWKKVRQEILNNQFNKHVITPVNIDSMIIGFCTKPEKYQLASSYIKFLQKEKIKPNLATNGKYLKLLYEKNTEKCLKADENEILGIYEELRKGYPVLDSFTIENLILGLSVTKEWKKCLELFEEIKITAIANNSVYSAFISSAFLNNEEDLAWQFLNELIENNRTPKSIIFTSYLATAKKLKSKEKIHAKLEKMFEFLKNNDLRLEKTAIEKLEELSTSLKVSTMTTKVDFKGTCKNCRQNLDTFELTNEEFQELKDVLFKNVILGRDIFVKTSPQEMSNFQNFILQQEKFDVVLDGLNIAFSVGTKHPPHVFSTLLANVVKYFVDLNKRVLVLGRVHMHRWPQQTWGYVKSNSTIFLTQNISEDDPYLLYCALNSGKNTKIVTRDLMRGHKFLLKSPKYKTLFNRWLTQRQYQLLRIDQRGQPIFKHPLPISPVAQKNGTHWHLPYDEVENNKNEYLNSWCCLQLMK